LPTDAELVSRARAGSDAAFGQLVEPSLRDFFDGAVHKDHVERSFGRGAGFQRTNDDFDTRDILANSCRSGFILLQRHNAAGQLRDHGCRIPRARRDIENAVGFADGAAVEQLGKITRSQQPAARTGLNHDVGIGRGATGFGNEGFARNSGHGGDQPAVGHVVRTDLAVDHRGASGFKIHE